MGTQLFIALVVFPVEQDSSIYINDMILGRVYDTMGYLICIFYTLFYTKISPELMQIFTNGKWCCYPFMESYVIHPKTSRGKNLIIQVVTLKSVYDRFFFLFAPLNLLSVLICIAKKNFPWWFSFPVFWCTKSVKFYFQWVHPQDQKQETGNDCDFISGLQASQKTDFSVIFLLWAN